MKTYPKFFLECSLHNLTRPKASLADAPNFLDKSISACSFDIAILKIQI